MFLYSKLHLISISQDYYASIEFFLWCSLTGHWWVRGDSPDRTFDISFDILGDSNGFFVSIDCNRRDGMSICGDQEFRNVGGLRWRTDAGDWNRLGSVFWNVCI